MLEHELAEHYSTVPHDPEAEARIRAAVAGSHAGRRLSLGAASVVVMTLVAVGLVWLQHAHSQRRTAASGPPPHHRTAAHDPLAPLYGDTWTDPAAGVSFVFAAGTVHRADGCSGATNTVTADSGRLRIGGQVGTAYGCGGGMEPAPGEPGYAAFVRKQAATDKLDHVLAAAPHWSVSGATLTLSAHGQSVRLGRVGTVSGEALRATQWVLRGYTSDQSSGAARPGLTLTFDGYNGFVATDGCGAITGTMRIDTTTVDFSGSRASASCSWVEPIAGPTVDDLLSRKVSFRRTGDLLVLSVPSTRLTLVYARR